MLPEKSSYLLTLVGDAFSQMRVEDVIAGRGISVNDILAFVEAAFEGYFDDPFLGATTHKVRLFIIKHVKKSPGDGLDYRGFSRSVSAGYGLRST